MSTLLLRLAAPLQAWGVDAKYEEVRGTGRQPSKSGVVGLLAAALGRRRDADLTDLNALRFGLRVEQEGQLLRDYHTAHSVKHPYITNRYYLADACFLVGLECEDEAFLQTLLTALKNPVFPLFLGRRSCPPGLPLVLGIRPLPLLEALRKEPWQASDYQQKRLTRNGSRPYALQLYADALPGEAAGMVKDVALRFDPRCRQYGYRAVKDYGMVPAGVTEHDPMEELR